MGSMADVRERIWRRVEVRGPDECWEWQGARTPEGYGVMGVGSATDGSRRTERVPRLVYEVEVGPIPEGAEVCHHCDNPPCVNPAHLFAGTHADNVGDAKRKGRLVAPPLARKGRATRIRGERVWTAKLTEADVRLIRQLFGKGAEKVDLARRYGMTRQGIHRIVTRRTWKHVA